MKNLLTNIAITQTCGRKTKKKYCARARKQRMISCFGSIVAVIFMLNMISCSKDDIGESGDFQAKVSNDDVAIELGNKNNDPYKFSNMSEAYNQLKKEGYDFPFSELSPTGTYVRVLPASENELDELEADTTIQHFGTFWINQLILSIIIKHF